jgi:hypothetical protein
MNEYGEFICKPCAENKAQNDAEAAYERYIASYHDGGATQWNTLEMVCIEARKLK